MRPWEIGSAAFFLYAIAVALLLPRLGRAARWRAVAVASVGLALVLLSVRLGTHDILHGWILPPVLLLLAYWSSGALFVAPMPWAERMLEGADRALRMPALAARTPRWLAEVLELAYAGVYPLIPIALALHLLFAPDADANRFWAVVFFTDFICFGMLPWIQTRPPRALEGRPPWQSSLRPLNVGLLGAASIHVNTFPSGHAAEALAVALLVLGAPWPIAGAMFAAALAVSAGAVLGRYHYGLDAVAGWAVALCVWTLV